MLEVEDERIRGMDTRRRAEVTEEQRRDNRENKMMGQGSNIKIQGKNRGNK